MTTPLGHESAYQSAFTTQLRVVHQHPRILHLNGSDSLDLLHRMSTNDMADIRPGTQRMTVFTDPVGRTIDWVTVLAIAESVLLVCTQDRAEKVRDWLQRHIFFQDDVQLMMEEAEWALIGEYGPDAIEPGQADTDRVVETDDGYRWLEARLTMADAQRAIARVMPGIVQRYEVPGLRALKFVVRDALPGGVYATLHAGLHWQKATISSLPRGCAE